MRWLREMPTPSRFRLVASTEMELSNLFAFRACVEAVLLRWRLLEFEPVSVHERPGDVVDTERQRQKQRSATGCSCRSRIPRAHQASRPEGPGTPVVTQAPCCPPRASANGVLVRRGAACGWGRRWLAIALHQKVSREVSRQDGFHTDLASAYSLQTVAKTLGTRTKCVADDTSSTTWCDPGSARLESNIPGTRPRAGPSGCVRAFVRRRNLPLDELQGYV